MIKYYKNCILCGNVDYLCLLCEESFETVEEVEKHIRWEQHRKLIRTQDYFPKLRKDSVHKIKNIFYCEICNYITPELETIKNHVKEESHKIKKVKPDESKKEELVKREYGFIKVPKYAVNKREWHGVVNRKCLLCETTVNDFDSHITAPSHVINLIQAQVKVSEDGETYRQIKAEIFYCFKCKKTYPQTSFESHWKDDEHCGKVQFKGVCAKQLFELDRENCLVTCNLCKKTLLWSWLQMYEHRGLHTKNEEWTVSDVETEYAFKQLDFQDKGKMRHDLKVYGKENYIKLNEGGSKGYCSLCNTYVSAHIRNFRQHVQGLRHINYLELNGLVRKTKKSEKPRFRTKPFEMYFKDTVHIKSSNLFFINGDISIGMLSFMMLAPVNHPKKILCFICDGGHVFPDLSSHLDSDHKEKLLKIEVITSFKDEFIREIRSGLYHCGICNKAYAGWSVLERHLNSFKHKFTKVQNQKMIQDAIDSTINDCVCSSIPDIRSVDVLD